MEALLAELEPSLGSGWQSKVFRINRDLRFARDKRPYNEHVAGVFTSNARAAGFYLQMAGEGLYVAMGSYRMAPDQLARYRDAVAGKEGDRLARIVSTLVTDGYEVGEPSLRRVPTGYPVDHPRGELLRRTSMVASRSWRPGPWLHTAEALARVRDVWRNAKPLTTWLETHVGPSTAPARERH